MALGGGPGTALRRRSLPSAVYCQRKLLQIQAHAGGSPIGVMLPYVYGGELAAKVIAENHSFFCLVQEFPVFPLS